MLRLTWPLFVVAAVAGCPSEPECSSFRDCQLREACSAEGLCVPAEGPAPVGEGEGEPGEGEDEVIDEVDLESPVSMFIRDPRNEDRALLAQKDANTDFDELRGFDLVTGVLDADAELDFDELDGGCGVDNVLVVSEAEVGQTVLPDGDELWLTCRDAGDLTIQYPVSDLSDSFETDLPVAALARVVVADAVDTAEPSARVVLANRGGSTLTIVAIDEDDDEREARATEPVLGATFTDITAIFVVDNSGLADEIGDVILIFDRGSSPPRLVPLRRDANTLSWIGPPYNDTDLDTLELPADTHAVIFRENIGIVDLTDLDNIDDADEDIPNVVAVRPLAGFVSFFRYESDHESVQTNFTELELNAEENELPAALPPATDRVLLEETGPAADPLYFYAMTNAAVAFRFPLHTGTEDRSDEVLEAEFNDSDADRPNGMVPILGEPTTAWFSLSNELRLHRVIFDSR